MRLRNAIKQSCDIYFYEMARLLGVDKLSIIAKRYGLGENILKDVYFDEKKGVVPDTFWKKMQLARIGILVKLLLMELDKATFKQLHYNYVCLLYTSPSPRDRQKSRMPSSA